MILSYTPYKKQRCPRNTKFILGQWCPYWDKLVSVWRTLASYILHVITVYHKVNPTAFPITNYKYNTALRLHTRSCG